MLWIRNLKCAQTGLLGYKMNILCNEAIQNKHILEESPHGSPLYSHLIFVQIYIITNGITMHMILCNNRCNSHFIKKEQKKIKNPNSNNSSCIEEKMIIIPGKCAWWPETLWKTMTVCSFCVWQSARASFLSFTSRPSFLLWLKVFIYNMMYATASTT